MSLITLCRNEFFGTLAKQLGYSGKDILIIVNTDDVGMHQDITDASFKSFHFGMVKAGSLMVPCPNFNYAIERWRENPIVDLGIHLTLTCEWGDKYPWTPLLSKTKVPSLYNPNGIMWSDIPELLHNAKKSEILMELEAQIVKVIQTGLKPTHIDDHMDLHNHLGLFPIIMKLSKKYKLPMRVWKRRRYKYPILKYNLLSLRKKGFVFPDSQKGLYYLDGANQSANYRKDKYHNYMRSLKPGVHNIKLHIAFETEEMKKIMGNHFSSIRQIDYDVWASDDTKKLAKDLGIKFIGYSELQRFQRKLMQ